MVSPDYENQDELLEECETVDLTTTYGGKAVGLTFNPSGNSRVQELKELYAQIINILYDERGEDRNERARLLSVAITEAQTAQMWAVKGVTFEK